MTDKASADLRNLVVFRADASDRIGGGHVMRCLVLAGSLAMSGWRCAFASRPETFPAVSLLSVSGHELVEISCGQEDEPEFLTGRWPGGCGILVVDHFDRGAEFESACRSWAGRIMAIEDVPNRKHECDIMFDHTPNRTNEDYAGLLSPHCRTLLGPDFALLRPQFAKARAKALLRRRRETAGCRVFIGVGAVDDKNMTTVALQGIAKAGVDVEVDVVIGPAARNLEEVKVLAEKLPVSVALHIDSREVAGLMSRADIAIGGAGTGSWERCCVGLPSLVIVTDDNQKAVAAELTRSGAAVNLGEWPSVTSAEIAQALRLLADDPERRNAMAEAAASLCDGLGADRLAGELVRDLADGSRDMRI